MTSECAVGEGENSHKLKSQHNNIRFAEYIAAESQDDLQVMISGSVRESIGCQH